MKIALEKLLTNVVNGKLAGDFVREKFSYVNIYESWTDVLSGKNTKPNLPFNWQTPKDFFRDLMRWSKTSALYYSWRSSLDRKMLKDFKKNN